MLELTEFDVVASRLRRMEIFPEINVAQTIFNKESRLDHYMQVSVECGTLEAAPSGAGEGV